MVFLELFRTRTLDLAESVNDLSELWTDNNGGNFII